MGENESSDIMREMIAALHEWIEREKAACQDCGGYGEKADYGGLDESGEMSALNKRSCSTCAALDAIKAKWCWHEWKQLGRSSVAECKHCKATVDNQVEWPILNPTPTIETLRQMLEDCGEWEGFIWWLSYKKLGQSPWKLADILTKHENGVPVFFIEKATGYLEAWTSA